MKDLKVLTEGPFIGIDAHPAAANELQRVKIDFIVKVSKGKKHAVPSLQLKTAVGVKSIQLGTNDQKTWYGWITVDVDAVFDIKCWCLVNKQGTLTLTGKETNFPLWSRKTGPQNGKCIIQIPDYKVG